MKNKRIIYKGDSSYPNVLGSVEAAHSGLCASINIFSNDRPHFEAEIVDPQKLAQKTSLSRHRKIMSRHCFVCPPPLSWCGPYPIHELARLAINKKSELILELWKIRAQ